MKNLFMLLLLIFTALNQMYAQGNIKDTINNDYFYNDSISYPFHISFDLGYGLSLADSKAIFGDFNEMGSWNVFFNIGNYKTFYPTYTEKSTGLKYYTIFTFGLQAGNSTTQISLPSSKDEKISMSIFRISPKILLAEGFGSTNFRIVPYTVLPSFGFYAPNRISYKNIPQDLSTGDRNFLDNYIDRINFGSIRESGVMFHIDRKFNINLSYENLIAYPRLLMGKDIGMTFVDLFASGLIYAGTINLLWTKTATNPKPNLISVIVNFILQNAYKVTTQYLRRDNMNWPFKSSKSIMIESFRLNFGYIL